MDKYRKDAIASSAILFEHGMDWMLVDEVLVFHFDFGPPRMSSWLNFVWEPSSGHHKSTSRAFT